MQTKELNYAMFPLNKEELRKVYGIQNEAPDDKIHHLSLDGVDMKSHMVLYIIHYTKMADGKYRKCVNSRFAMPDTGVFVCVCVCLCVCVCGVCVRVCVRVCVFGFWDGGGLDLYSADI